MKTRDKKDEMILTLALLEQLEQDEEIRDFGGNEEGASHAFSERHKKRMEDIFRAAARAEKKQRRRRQFRRAAAGLAACLFVSAALVFSSSAFRIPVMNFFTEVKEKYSELRVEKAQKNHVTENFAEYEPGYVAKGFDVLEVEEGENFFKIHYLNEIKRWYTFAYYETAHSTQVDTEHVSVCETEIGGNKVNIYDKGTYIQAVLYYGSHQFIVSGELDREEIKKILESL